MAAFDQALRYFLAVLLLLAAATPVWSRNFEITNLYATSPEEVLSKSTADSYVSFDFQDQDTTEVPWVHCNVTWTAGSTPPSIPAPGACTNDSVTVSFPDGSYSSVEDMTLTLSHTYIDNSIGQAPYNVLTKFGNLTLSYPQTPDYDCDTATAICESCSGQVIVVNVTSEVA